MYIGCFAVRKTTVYFGQLRYTYAQPTSAEYQVHMYRVVRSRFQVNRVFQAADGARAKAPTDQITTAIVASALFLWTRRRPALPSSRESSPPPLSLLVPRESCAPQFRKRTGKGKARKGRERKGKGRRQRSRTGETNVHVLHPGVASRVF